MLFLVLARKTFDRNLQYRSAHMIHNIASALFGFIYMSVWRGIAEGRSLGEYGTAGILSYVAFNQCILWITSFQTNGLGLPQAVRTGAIALELMRPVHLFYQLICRESGQIAYQFLYKFLPIYAVYFFALPIRVPQTAAAWLWTSLALLLAAYISLCIQFLIGAAALWTTESTWMYWSNYALSTLLSGFLIPVEWLPGPLAMISRFSFYPYLQYVPSRIYLEMDGPERLIGALIWCVCLTAVCVAATAIMRRKVEVQGG
ncbi:ABC transporter permease [Paenibacillus beijingensis]|uniref:ABC transporter permease n=1 Tax=Paenibacillus beijingensis TaxID=1126833 RepID=A0A0D5NJG1_9BACL|nr:ABC-2 family transporter protein [Paenibacillus beijingensis]AJY75514.1 hypothetical protein VN24_14260 [Paenibacillus beijingensis]